MSNFAQIDENNIVVNVIRSETPDDDFPKNPLPLNHKWVRTSYNRNIRKNFAGIGMLYDAQLDAFYNVKPYDSWILNEDCIWIPPVTKPEGIQWIWNEEKVNWDELPELRGIVLTT
jgi:hypothetical protein